MKKLMVLSVACAAFFLASCGGGNKNNSTTETSTSGTEAPAQTETATPAASANESVSNTINLTGNDQMKYSDTAFTVKAGEEITLTLKNVGKLPAKAMSHDVVVLKPGTSTSKFGMAATQARDLEKLSSDLKSKIIAKTKLLGPGEEATITFTLPAPGAYPFVCSFPGHYATMHGTITAK